METEILDPLVIIERNWYNKNLPGSITGTGIQINISLRLNGSAQQSKFQIFLDHAGARACSSWKEKTVCSFLNGGGGIRF